MDRLSQEDFKDYTGYEPEPYRSDLLKYLDILDRLIDKRVPKYGELRMKECEVKTIKETEKPLNEAIPHEYEIEKSFKLQSKVVQINPVHTVDANLVVTKSSGTKSHKQDTSSKSGNYITHAMDADIRPVNDQEPFTKVDSNTTPDLTNMSSRGGDIDQNAKKSQVTSPLLDPLSQPNTKIEKLLKENEHLKQTYKDLYDSIKKTRV
nr:hypothetical protein [Tanacetum cinerariifolium]